jgi:hypothetical protein
MRIRCWFTEFIGKFSFPCKMANVYKLISMYSQHEPDETLVIEIKAEELRHAHARVFACMILSNIRCNLEIRFMPSRRTTTEYRLESLELFLSHLNLTSCKFSMQESYLKPTLELALEHPELVNLKRFILNLKHLHINAISSPVPSFSKLFEEYTSLSTSMELTINSDSPDFSLGYFPHLTTLVLRIKGISSDKLTSLLKLDINKLRDFTLIWYDMNQSEEHMRLALNTMVQSMKTVHSLQNANLHFHWTNANAIRIRPEVNMLTVLRSQPNLKSLSVGVISFFDLCAVLTICPLRTLTSYLWYPVGDKYEIEKYMLVPMFANHPFLIEVGDSTDHETPKIIYTVRKQYDAAKKSSWYTACISRRIRNLPKQVFYMIAAYLALTYKHPDWI